MEDYNIWLLAIAPAVGPLATAMAKKAMPYIPKFLLPILSTIVSAWAAVFAGAGPQLAVAVGGSSVAVREVVDQAIMKPRKNA